MRVLDLNVGVVVRVMSKKQARIKACMPNWSTYTFNTSCIKNHDYLINECEHGLCQSRHIEGCMSSQKTCGILWGVAGVLLILSSCVFGWHHAVNGH